jgi:hypothetical protein
MKSALGRTLPIPGKSFSSEFFCNWKGNLTPKKKTFSSGLIGFLKVLELGKEMPKLNNISLI